MLDGVLRDSINRLVELSKAKTDRVREMNEFKKVTECHPIQNNSSIPPKISQYQIIECPTPPLHHFMYISYDSLFRSLKVLSL